MKTLSRTLAAAAIGLAGLTAEAPDVQAGNNNVGLSGCLDIGGIFSLCADSRGQHGIGIPFPHDPYRRHEIQKVEIARVPAPYRCPAGTDSEALIGNQFPGTPYGTKICYDHYRR